MKTKTFKVGDVVKYNSKVFNMTLEITLVEGSHLYGRVVECSEGVSFKIGDILGPYSSVLFIDCIPEGVKMMAKFYAALDKLKRVL